MSPREIAIKAIACLGIFNDAPHAREYHLLLHFQAHGIEPSDLALASGVRRSEAPRIGNIRAKPPDRLHFVRVRLETRDGRLHACPTGDQSSGVLRSMVQADGLAIVAAETTEVPSGATLPVQLLHRDDLRETPGF